jgi:hypothetical protein
MNTKKKYTAATFLIATLLGGCTSMDGAMSSTSDFLDTTGDVLSGDFRGLTAAQRTTMTEMAVDWKQNENNAKKKWDERRLVVTGIVTRVTHSDGFVGKPGKYVIVFKELSNPKCIGVATTRDDLMVNDKRTSVYKTGDRIDVTGVLQTRADVDSDGAACHFAFEHASFALNTAPR